MQWRSPFTNVQLKVVFGKLASLGCWKVSWHSGCPEAHPVVNRFKLVQLRWKHLLSWDRGYIRV